MKEREDQEITEKTRRPATSSGTSSGVGPAGNQARSTWAEGDKVSTEQRRNEMAGETGDPQENTPTSGIVRHDSH
ncbi:hypothetical protein PR048_019721 [Dryococelus australis]|uniref:Uncharacterized protein n=1 Tax=Dryococelus australis TaxID=614101 RepID=A0ABQ9H4D8_9NEOP|nr:hypothetical protein PR048_019721 [Dryococelus australis]